MFALMLSDSQDGLRKNGDISYMLHSGMEAFACANTLVHPYNNVSNMLSGNFSLRGFAKQLRNWHYQTGSFKTYPLFPY